MVGWKVSLHSCKYMKYLKFVPFLQIHLFKSLDFIIKQTTHVRIQYLYLLGEPGLKLVSQ